MKLKTKRIYQVAERSDGRRILVDRLWPRGLSKASARIDYWAREIAPSSELRRWYRHDPRKWAEFRRRYFEELEANPGSVAELRGKLGQGTSTLLFSSKETRLNNAVALKEFLEGR